jgi:hypothetical protein
MKKFLTVVGLVTVMATPAFAQSFDPDMGTGNNLPFAYSTPAKDSANAAFARADVNVRANAASNQSENDYWTHGNLGGSVVNGYVHDGY